MFWRVIRRMALANRGRLFVILLALGAGSAVTAALLNLQMDASRRIESEFQAFGPNVVIAPRAGTSDKSDTMDESVLDVVQPKPFDKHYVGIPYLYLVAKLRGDSSTLAANAVVAGTFLEQLGGFVEQGSKRGWRMESQAVALSSADQCYVGTRLGKRLELQPGSTLELQYGHNQERCTVLGFLVTGGPEDDQALLNLRTAQRLAGTPGRISLVKTLVLGPPEFINKTIDELQKRFPELDVRPVRQFTEGQARIYGKISGILVASVAVVLLLTSLCVMAAMTNIAAERKNDVGLMKAIGGSVRRVLRIFLAEAALLGLAAGLLGAAAGILLSIGLGKAVFGVAARPRPVVYPVSVALTVIVAILAAYPLRRLANIRPASVFRGEE